MLKTGDSSWEAMIPEELAEIIKRRGLFSHAPRTRVGVDSGYFLC